MDSVLPANPAAPSGTSSASVYAESLATQDISRCGLRAMPAIARPSPRRVSMRRDLCGVNGEGQGQNQIADDLRPAIEAVLDDLERWLTPTADEQASGPRKNI